MQELSDELKQGHKVMVAVDADELWSAGQDPMVDDLLNDYPGLPGQDANHEVQVVDIEGANTDNPVVVLNDPGSPNGQGVKVPADEFMNMFADSGNYAVIATGHRIEKGEPVLLGALDRWGRPYWPSSGAYYQTHE